MPAVSAGPGARGRLRGVWIGVAWAEAGVVVATVLTVVAFVREIDCLFWCTEEESRVGAGFWVLLGLAAAALLGGFALAARASGERGWRVAGRGALAVVVLLAVLSAGGALRDTGFVPALVVAVGLAGAAALRPPSPAAWRSRLVALLALGVAAAVAGLASGGLVLLVLLATLPVVGAADTYALRLEATAER